MKYEHLKPWGLTIVSFAFGIAVLSVSYNFDYGIGRDFNLVLGGFNVGTAMVNALLVLSRKRMERKERKMFDAEIESGKAQLRAMHDEMFEALASRIEQATDGQVKVRRFKDEERRRLN